MQGRAIAQEYLESIGNPDGDQCLTGLLKKITRVITVKTCPSSDWIHS